MVEKNGKGPCTTLDLSYLNMNSMESPQELKPRPGSKKCKQNDFGKYICTALKLNNNNLTSSVGLYALASKVVENPEKITWLDLSCNRLTEIPEDIVKFPGLKVVYLHGNHLVDLALSIKLLKGLASLYSVTLHGNPIEQRKNYKNKILMHLPTVRSLDFANITPADRRQLEELLKQPTKDRFNNLVGNI